MEEIEKIKRKKKVNDQDKQQPGTIQDLIRRYDLDNIKEADYFDYLVDYLKRDITEKENLISILNSQMTDKEQRVSTLETNKVIKDFGTINFQAAANQKIKITIPITSSALYASKLIVRVQPNYNSANYQGCLEKTFSFVSTPSNIFGGGSAEYTYIGNNADVFAISDAALINGNIEIVIAFQSNKATTTKLMMEAYYSSNGTKTCIENATVGQIYTTDTTVLPTPTYGFNKIVVPKEGLQSYTSIVHSSILNEKVFILPHIAWSYFQESANINAYFRNLLVWICENYPNIENGTWIITANPNNKSTAIINIYDTSDVDSNTSLPRYSSITYTQPGGIYGVSTCGTYDYIYKDFRSYVGNNNIGRVDLDTVIQGGFYYCNNCTNIPTGESNGYLIVHSTNPVTAAYATQTYIPYSKNRVYRRILNNGTWGTWMPAGEESGTWTPRINTRANVAPTVTYATQTGTYRKIGNMVFITFLCRGKITALNDTNNYGVIAGLPFVPKTYSGYGQCAISVACVYNLITQTDFPTIMVRDTYNGQLYIQRSNGASAGVLKVSGDNNFQISGSGWYEIA